MARPKEENPIVSRRTFLQSMRWASGLFLPAPFYTLPFGRISRNNRVTQATSFPLADLHLTPHYPAKSPLEELLRQVAPGFDEYLTEKYSLEIMQHLAAWSAGLKAPQPAPDAFANLLDDSIHATPLAPAQETSLRSGAGIEVAHRRFPADLSPGRERFLNDLHSYFAAIGRFETAEFLIIGIESVPDSASAFRIDIRYDLVGTRPDNATEERIGSWRTQWSRDDARGWRILRWEATEEIVSLARRPGFVDVTLQALGQCGSYRQQLLHGADYWRTVVDGACGIDVYGNNGLAVGDIDNDGRDDLYVCQPSGLPNRLYRNRGDGTFEDATDAAGVGVLDGTACALFADFQNQGLQDLLVVSASGPQLFLNQGKGKFQLKRDAFKFAQPAQGTFTHAALADYDADGRLDIYFCVYSYYVGLDQYHYPAPYFDARNGPPNFLFHNEGNATFVDRTEAAGLNAENDRYSFACAWGDSNGDGRPDLYVANDFGRNNLYRNDGNGRFAAISDEAHVQEVGAGMSACWLDFDNDGAQDIYVSNMWSPAGLRVSQQKQFHEKDPERIRSLYRQHARGNSLYRNQGNGSFQNVSQHARVALGRWAWSADSWDIDHDGYPDLYIANGYISGSDTRDLGSFFWRHVVGASPPNSSPSPEYERGWNAINELIRSDVSWSGYERNVCYLNNHDGTFSEVSGVLGLDFPDDSRSFVLSDLDGDGRLEIILKNRNAPQLRVLRNAMQDIGHSVAFRLQGTKSNRDAIGTAVTVEAETLRQTKYLQAGSGFLAQHGKELFFGLGRASDIRRAMIRWPSGVTQTFEHLPVNHRIEIREGSPDFQAKPFGLPPASYARASDPPTPESLPSLTETWLIDPLHAPDFSLPDLAGDSRTLETFRGNFVLLSFWTTDSPASRDQVQLLQRYQSTLPATGLHLVGMNVDDPSDARTVRSFAAKQGLSFPTLIVTSELAGIYNIVYRYLFDRRRDLPVPTSFLIDDAGMIVKVYQGVLNPERAVEDLRSAPKSADDRLKKALPFPGLVPEQGFQRNDFTYGVALFQRGYLDHAAESFKQVIARKPQYPEAYYNLGTLYLRRNALADARRNLQQTVDLRPNYPEAWNNLGMIAAQEGQQDEAIRNFERSLQLRPDYTVALLNLGNLYRRQGTYGEAEKLLNRALEIEPEDPEVNYSVGMLYARQNQLSSALQYLEKAVSLRPDYADALNNLGVLFVREQRYSEAEERLKTCIRVAPNFDQAYLNLARLYVVLKDEAKAKEVLQALLRLQPEHKMAQQALEMLH
jgi:Flp pilus assembly protein TadD/peroxiredoxin